MSDENTTIETDAEDDTLIFKPPVNSWQINEIVKATPAQLKASVVDCHGCPVFFLCESGEGGTGFICQSCRSTGVFIDKPEQNEMPVNVYSIDCASHKFHQDDRTKHMGKCPLCSGDIVRLINETIGAKTHYVATVHATIPLEERVAFWKEAFKKYEKAKAAKAAKGG